MPKRSSYAVCVPLTANFFEVHEVVHINEYSCAQSYTCKLTFNLSSLNLQKYLNSKLYILHMN
jgi:hypothetical protein